jgi:hypothetical protein
MNIYTVTKKLSVSLCVFVRRFAEDIASISRTEDGAAAAVCSAQAALAYPGKAKKVRRERRVPAFLEQRKPIFSVPSKAVTNTRCSAAVALSWMALPRSATTITSQDWTATGPTYRY